MKKYLIHVLFLGICAICQGQCPADHSRFGASLWKYQTGGKIFSSPILYHHLILFGSGDGDLYALGMTDGKLQWHFPTGGIIHTGPVLSGNTLYFGSADGCLYAMHLTAGTVLH